jgi:hypothetical protein
MTPGVEGAMWRATALLAAAHFAIQIWTLPRLLRTFEVATSAVDLVAAFAWGLALSVLLAVGAGALARAIARLGWPRAAAGVLVLAGGLTWSLHLIDLQVAAAQGLHLYWPIVQRALDNAEPNREMHLGAGVFLLVGGVCLAFFLTLAGAVVRFMKTRPTPGPWPRRVVSAGLFAALVFAAAGQTAFAPETGMARALTLFEPLFGAVPPGPIDVPVPVFPAVGPPTMRSKPDVLIVAVESLRADAFTPEHMPIVSRSAAERGCRVSRQHFASGTSTEQGIFSLIYGLDAHRFIPFAEAQPPVPALTLSTLRQNGYHTWGASASALRAWNGAALMVDQLEAYHEPDHPSAAVRDGLIADFALGRTERAPAFGFLFFDATHFDYDAPPDFTPYGRHPRPDFGDLFGGDRMRHKADAIRARYLNAVRWVDRQLGRVLAAQGPETFIAIVGDHGEAFWEDGQLGHGTNRFHRVRVEVPLILCLPAGTAPAREIDRSTHVDVMATLFEVAGAPLPLDGFSLRAPRPPDAPPIQIAGAGFPVDTGDLCLVDGDVKRWLVLSRPRFGGPASASGLRTGVRRVTGVGE